MDDSSMNDRLDVKPLVFATSNANSQKARRRGRVGPLRNAVEEVRGTDSTSPPFAISRAQLIAAAKKKKEAHPYSRKAQESQSYRTTIQRVADRASHSFADRDEDDRRLMDAVFDPSRAMSNHQLEFQDPTIGALTSRILHEKPKLARPSTSSWKPTPFQFTFPAVEPAVPAAAAASTNTVTLDSPVSSGPPKPIRHAWFFHFRPDNGLAEASSDPFEVAPTADPIGAGSYGKVYELSAHPNLILKTKLLEKGAGIPEDIVREINAYAAVDQHPNVANIHAVKLQLVHVGQSSAPSIGLIMPKASGSDLDNFCSKRLHLLRQPEQVRHLMFQWLNGLQALHASQVVHLDIKPQNALVQQQANGDKLATFSNGRLLVQLADFGLARVIDGNMSGVTLAERCYTVCYRPPEFWDTGLSFDTRSDVWATACCFFELASGGKALFPWKSLDKMDKNQRRLNETQGGFDNRSMAEMFCATFGITTPCNTVRETLAIGVNSRLEQRAVSARLVAMLSNTQQPSSASASAASAGRYSSSSRAALAATTPYLAWDMSFRSKVVDLISSMLRWSLVDRPTASTLLNYDLFADLRRSSSLERFSWFKPQHYQRSRVDWLIYMKHFAGGDRMKQHQHSLDPVFDQALEFSFSIAVSMRVMVHTWLVHVTLLERTLIPFVFESGRYIGDVSTKFQAVQRWALACLRNSARIKQYDDYNVLLSDIESGDDINDGLDDGTKPWNNKVYEAGVARHCGFIEPRTIEPAAASASSSTYVSRRGRAAAKTDQVRDWFRAEDDAWVLETVGGYVTMFDRWTDCRDERQVRALLQLSCSRHRLFKVLLHAQEQASNSSSVASSASATSRFVVDDVPENVRAAYHLVDNAALVRSVGAYVPEQVTCQSKLNRVLTLQQIQLVREAWAQHAL